MEPTIYKPSIYKGAGIYKTGAGGGGGQIQKKQIYGQHNFYMVDSNGYIGSTVSNVDSINCLVDTNADYSELGLGQVKFYNKKINNIQINGLNFETTIINGREWIAQNIDILLNGMNESVITDEPCAVWYNYNEQKYGRSGDNYGRLYNKFAVELIQSELNNIAPGWRIPNNADFQNLYNDSGYSISGKVLSKSIGGFYNWGTDDFSFNARPAGIYASGFYNIDNRVVFPLYDGSSLEWFIIIGNSLAHDYNYNDGNWFCSLRLCRDVV